MTDNKTKNNKDALTLHISGHLTEPVSIQKLKVFRKLSVLMKWLLLSLYWLSWAV